MIYLVVNITNYDTGLYVAGYYKTWERAEKRLKWCEKHLHNNTPDGEFENEYPYEDRDNCDSWQILPVMSPNITSTHGLPLKKGGIGNEASL